MFAASDQVLQQQCPSVPIMEIDGRWRAHIQQAPNCPRCASSNTKFCYYNNYSLAQPRYFCKGCRRYWTKGGSLRNVPEGGGCRKTRRSRSKASSSSLHDSPEDKGCPQGVNGSGSSLSSAGPDIDLAAVFARYLNQDSGPPSQLPSEGEGFTNPSSAIEQDVQLVSQHTDQSQYLFETLDHHQVAVVDQGFAANLESLDHGLLQTEDVFWSTSEDGSSLSSGFTAPWEPMAQQEELDSSPLAVYASALDDQFSSPLTSSFTSDINWSCFDLAGCGDFTIVFFYQQLICSSVDVTR